MNFRESLEQTLSAVPGALALSLVGDDGIGIESAVRESPVDLDNLSAELTTFIRGLSTAHADLKLGRLQQVALMSPEYVSILASVTPEYYLLCVMERRGFFGKARYELKKLAWRLEGELQ
jgi:predicted regulator of Ras-like GTPase activity (Roadblock/LC7/MglB family)